MKDRRSDVVTLVDVCKSLGLATKHAGRHFPKACSFSGADRVYSASTSACSCES